MGVLHGLGYEVKQKCGSVFGMLHMEVAKVLVGNLPLLYTTCPSVVPIIPLERNHSLRSGKMPFSPTIPSIIAPVSPLVSVWITMTPP